MDEEHRGTVRQLQKQIATFYTTKKPFRIYHGSTNSTRVLTFKKSEMVDISHMNRVLTVNKTKQTAIVEPNVPMDKLVEETLKYGLIPPVVTEFPGITVGGGIQGAAAESSSFRWGCFSQTLNWMEIILANGETVKISPKQNADLFYGTAGSYGSLGLVTATEIKLLPAKRYVQVSSFQEALDVIKKYTKSSCDFIECNMFSKNRGAVVIGNLSDTVHGKVRHFLRAHDPWYYMYVEKLMNEERSITETLPLKDYLFRHDRGAFWGGRMAFEHLNVPFNRFSRFVLNPLLHTRKLYEALQESAVSQIYICQDLVLPSKTVLSFLEFIDKQFSKYPIVIWPMKPEPKSPLQCNGINADIVYNVGVYGLRVEKYEKFVTVNKQIETKTRELGGKKWFYAHSFYSRKEFWQIYDKKWYDALRTKYYATSLPDIYDRTHVHEHYEIRSKRALFRTIFGKAKLRMVD